MDSKSQIANQKSQVQLVCFDLGRVLIRLCDTWQHGCRRAGVPVPDYPLQADVRARLLEAVVDSESGRIDIHEFARIASPQLGLSERELKTVSDVYLIEPYPGAVELLDDLHRRGLTTACLSNTNDNHWRIVLDESGPFHAMMSRLDYCFGSHLVGTRKPDPMIYQHVERETGVAGERILFFDDIAENVEAARKRGWRAQLIARDVDPIQQIRTHLAGAGLLATP